MALEEAVKAVLALSDVELQECVLMYGLDIEGNFS